jgi:two-component system cell cycle sensor histidine kinase/response regulator CckA
MTGADFTGTGTILLVEDDESVRRLIAHGLRSRGFDVIEAANGIEALKALENTRVDLLVSDIVMPEMDGPALLQAIHGRIPVLFISGYAEAPGGLSKPFTLGQLVTAVKRAMSQS